MSGFAGQKKILIESENLSSGWGTGIATYSTNLAKSLSALGHNTTGLLGTQTRSVPGENLLNEVLLRDPSLTKKKRGLVAFGKVMPWLHGCPFGAFAQRVNITGSVYGEQGSERLPFDTAYSIPHLAFRAKMHFRRYGSFLQVKGISEADILHTTHAVPLRLAGKPLFSTLHDLIPLRLPHATMENKKYYYHLVQKLLNECDRVVTVSDCSKRDIMDMFKVPEQKIFNTYQAVEVDGVASAMTDDMVDEMLRHNFGVGYREYYLFVGAIEPKKNVSRLVDAYALSATSRPLLIAGRLGWQYDVDVKKMSDQKFQPVPITGQKTRPPRTVQHLDYVKREALLLLMRGARALVFPSLYEGFGLPALEAMALGTPVITSNTSSLPEVCGNAARYVDPYDIGSIAAAIRDLDNDEDLIHELSVRGKEQTKLFSTDNYCKRLDELYSSV
jgi:glycosyltransferase involved in cell wall biosynthesis